MYDANALDNAELVTEGVIPDDLLDELAAEPSSGPWPVGWYRAQVIEGYATRGGKQNITSNVISNNGDSLNLILCFTVTNSKGETRNLNTMLNYRPEDFTAERMDIIKAAREEFKGVKVWPGAAKGLQASSLSIARVGQLKKAVGFSTRLVHGKIDPSQYFGQSIDVHLTQKANDKGQTFNNINEFAPAGTKAGQKG